MCPVLVQLVQVWLMAHRTRPTPRRCGHADLRLTGDRELGTLAQLLIAEGLDVASENLALRLTTTSPDKALVAIRAVADQKPPTEVELARQVVNKIAAKYDRWLGEELLSAQYATHLDCPAAVALAGTLAVG
jgi:hypothetical protein